MDLFFLFTPLCYEIEGSPLDIYVTRKSVAFALFSSARWAQIRSGSHVPLNRLLDVSNQIEG